MVWLALLLGFFCAGFLIWWLLIETEGVYLGRRAVVSLYDLYAGRYDRIKQADERADLVLIAEPLLDNIAPLAAPLVLDVATGTGRLPLILTRDARFRGHVVAVDASRRMLEQARRKVVSERFESFITLLRRDACDLPFPDASFDVVTCLEALEFTSDPQKALTEMVRLLRSGGLLLVTIRINTRWMPGRVWSQARMRQELESLDMRDIHFAIWQEDYSQVWAKKAGNSEPIGACRYAEVLSRSSQVPITKAAGSC